MGSTYVGRPARSLLITGTLCMALGTGTVSAVLTNTSSVLDSFGGWATNGQIRNVSAAGQPGGVSVSTNAGGTMVNYAGFLGGVSLKPGLDHDGDGLDDEVDADNDNDGLRDETEIAGDAFNNPPTPSTPTDVNDPDSDHDGFTDGEEAVAGTDPWDPTIRLEITAVNRTGSVVTVSWLARSNKYYHVRGDYLLTDGSVFTNMVATNVLAIGPAPSPWLQMTNTYQDTNAVSTNIKFYLIQAVP